MDSRRVLLKLAALNTKDCLVEQKDNVITVRDWEDKPIVEIIYYGEDDILLSREKEYVWCNEITRIINIKERLYIEYIMLRNNIPIKGKFEVTE